MQVTPKLRTRLLLQNGVFVVLLVALAALVAFFAREYRAEYDLTQSSRNTLTQQTRDVLTKLTGPIKVTVFATRQPEDTNGLPTTINWSSVPTMAVGNYTVQHVIDRLCQVTPVTDPTGTCMVRDSESAGSNKAGSLAYKNPASVYYRITVRVTGPKSTAAYVQALVLK